MDQLAMTPHSLLWTLNSGLWTFSPFLTFPFLAGVGRGPCCCGGIPLLPDRCFIRRPRVMRGSM